MAQFLQGVMRELNTAIWTAFAISFNYGRMQVAWHFPQDATLFAIYDLRHEWGAQFGKIIRDHSTLNKSYFRGQESNASLTLTQLSGHRSLWQRTGRIITIHIFPVAEGGTQLFIELVSVVLCSSGLTFSHCILCSILPDRLIPFFIFFTVNI